MNKLYGIDGQISNDQILPQHYDVPSGTPFYYGKQESLLNKLDNPTRINNFIGYNMPSPYQNPSSNYGVGPQAVNVTQEFLNAPNKSVFMKDPVLREPTRDNPMMNVMPLDYDAPGLFQDYNHYEKSTYPSNNDQKVRNLVKNNFEKGLYMDADSLLWNRLNSQRQFFSEPVGGVPNNQNEFATWLYSPNAEYNGLVCKSGSIFMNYGVDYTNDSLICNGVNSASPTNHGLLNGNLMSSVYRG
jgi:hypothetical protein